YLFLFAYGLQERDKSFWAVLLIMLSGFTKVYGIFQLAFLLCYPRFWRNMGYAVGIGVVLFALPLLKLSPSELLPYYREWIEALSLHQSSRIFDSVFFAEPFLNRTLPYFRIVQIGTLVLLAGLFLANYKKYSSFAFRAQALGILMGWVILFSDSAEKHTYVIALGGYLLWYWNHAPRRIDKVLFWANFVLLVLIPIDVVCPIPVMRFVCYTLWLNIWVFLFTWLRMGYITFIRQVEPTTPELQTTKSV
ncbi:MAG: glycosyltransferase family 87 protein, partial [Alistipes sp.]